MNIFKTRYSLLFAFILLFVLLSLALRMIFAILVLTQSEVTVATEFKVFGKGFIFDLAVALFFSVAYAVYLLIMPAKWSTYWLNRALTYAGFFIIILVCMFSFFAEIAFWNEFDSRLNFIAVDYLIYTYEVINNINQSYPLPYLIGGMILLALGIIFLFWKQKIFYFTFNGISSLRFRLLFTGIIILLVASAGFFLNNRWADKNADRYTEELSKAGIFSFFAAFRSNELDYNHFYLTGKTELIFSKVREDLVETGVSFNNNPYAIRRTVESDSTPLKPNVIMITIESFSADFMGHFGNKQELTPFLDSIAETSMLFTDMYGTGTRTVRGMEALTLSIPPTPGNSILRRANNNNLYSIGTVFKNAGYRNTFFYGGDGYFDNMNNYFGNNEFNIVDRGGRLNPGENFPGSRTRVTNSDVHFENAWGICDEDLYDAVLRDADDQHAKHQLFYNFVMTTSNHRPYTYPAGKIDIASGSGREGAVKYTDYAIGSFLAEAKTRPWFKNTVFIFVADHCASSAGKNEINIERYHIPCMIYNLPNQVPVVINKQCSQIDLYPTLFGILNWTYVSNFFGKNVLLPEFKPRAFLGTYQQLGYLVGDSLLVLGPREKGTQYLWNRKKKEQVDAPTDPMLLNKAIAYYQSAFYLFQHEGLKK